ncbi:hypothetical protein ACVWWJ_003444 [Luteibacter sp. HA06]
MGSRHRTALGIFIAIGHGGVRRAIDARSRRRVAASLFYDAVYRIQRLAKGIEESFLAAVEARDEDEILRTAGVAARHNFAALDGLKPYLRFFPGSTALTLGRAISSGRAIHRRMLTIGSWEERKHGLGSIFSDYYSLGTTAATELKRARPDLLEARRVLERHGGTSIVDRGED